MSSYRSTLQASLQAFNRTKTEFFQFPIVDRLNQLGGLYARLLRLEEVQIAQKNVDNLQAKFIEAQSGRRELAMRLSDIRKDNARFFNEMREAKRTEDDERYIELIRLEREGKRLENAVNTELNNIEKAERDLFTLFSNAIRSSHEKQRIQAEYTKYIGLAFSITGGLLSFLYIQLRRDTVVHHMDEKFKLVMNRLDQEHGNNSVQYMEDKFKLVMSRLDQELQSNNSVLSHMDKTVQGIMVRFDDEDKRLKVMENTIKTPESQNKSVFNSGTDDHQIENTKSTYSLIPYYVLFVVGGCLIFRLIS